MTRANEPFPNKEIREVLVGKFNAGSSQEQTERWKTQWEAEKAFVGPCFLAISTGIGLMIGFFVLVAIGASLFPGVFAWFNNL
jgi:hypothetical protein